MLPIVRQQGLVCLVWLLACLPSELRKRMGFVHSLEKWMVPVCKQTGHPEVERIWYVNKHGQRQQMNEDRAGSESCRYHHSID